MRKRRNVVLKKSKRRAECGGIRRAFRFAFGELSLFLIRGGKEEGRLSGKGDGGEAGREQDAVTAAKRVFRAVAKHDALALQAEHVAQIIAHVQVVCAARQCFFLHAEVFAVGKQGVVPRRRCALVADSVDLLPGERADDVVRFLDVQFT